MYVQLSSRYQHAPKKPTGGRILLRKAGPESSYVVFNRRFPTHRLAGMTSLIGGEGKKASITFIIGRVVLY